MIFQPQLRIPGPTPIPDRVVVAQSIPHGRSAARVHSFDTLAYADAEARRIASELVQAHMRA